MYEYCIMHRAFPRDPHRGPFAYQECADWIDSWREDGGRGDSFYIARRPVGDWERLEY